MQSMAARDSMHMAAESAREFEALERQAAGLMSVFMRAGFEAVAPAIIQPADVYLDVIGESLRRRTYVFTDPDGHELCLRPDLTVPTCRLYLARHAQADSSARFCYNGPAFRFQLHGANATHPNEFRQAGIEIIAGDDAERAETEALTLIIDAVRAAGLRGYQIRIGDLGLFHALLGDLQLPDRFRQRLRGRVWRPSAFRAELNRLALAAKGSVRRLPATLRGALDPADPVRAERGVAAYLDSQGIEPAGVRTLADITAGLLAATADAAAAPIPAQSAAQIEAYLNINAPLSKIVCQLEATLANAGPRTERALETFNRRLQLMAAAGLNVDALEFAAEFGRNLEYYTGFVFDIVVPDLGVASPIAGGGRYDGLMKAVGAAGDLPAVGSAIHTERLLEAVNPNVNRTAVHPIAAPPINGATAPALSKNLVLAVPSKGRLMDQTVDRLASAGLVLRKVGSERGYRGEIAGLAGLDVVFVSAAEVVQQLKLGRAHMGITGEDLAREEIVDFEATVELIAKLGFGQARVVVAVPQSWLDVETMSDLQEMARAFRRSNGRRLRVATKYKNLTRGYFSEKGVNDYLIVESLGATEGTPAAGTADLIVDITTTGTTLSANGLKVLQDGEILRSEANLVAARKVSWSPTAQAARSRLEAALQAPAASPGMTG